MSHFAFYWTSIRKKVIFLLVLAFVVVIFQLVYGQHSLTIQWQRRDSETFKLDSVAKIISSYLSKDSGQRNPLNDNRKRSDSFGLRIHEIEFVGNYEIEDEVDEKKYFKDINTAIKNELLLNSTKIGQDNIYEPRRMDSMLTQRPKVLEKISKLEVEKTKTAKTFKHLLAKKRLNTTGNTTIGLGSLNVHIWDNICEHKVESLKEFILFPNAPKFRFRVNKFETIGENLNNMGLRMFGFLHPNESGVYKFGISSRGNSELWLSNNTKSRNLKLVAFIDSEKQWSEDYSRNYEEFSSQISESVNLEKKKRYFVEVLYKHTTGSHGIGVAWMKPGTSNFQVISGDFLSLAINDSHVGNDTVVVEDYAERQRETFSRGNNYMPFMDFMDFGEAFPECEYEPSYYIKEKLVRFQGARNKSNTHFAEVHPRDTTNETLPLTVDSDIWWIDNNYGNDVIDNETAKHVGKMFVRTMEDKYNGTFKVIEQLSMERVIDKVKGIRYHIQAEVEDVYSGRHFEFSEFLYHPRGAGSLCFPRGFRWSKYATVNIIVPLKNNGRWALYFIKNIAEIVDQTRDPHVHVIIVDYESIDIDVEAVLKKSSLSRYTVVKLPGNKTFNRAEALQNGADAVKDPHSILFMCDLHLKIPAKLIEAVRKHCVEGKMAFAPVVKRLKCGFYPTLPFGYWETLGFGLFALYKSDFDRVGAMNVKEFQNWGGEDWELLDRVLESRIEVERLKIPSFYHFYHPAFGTGNSRFSA